MHMRREFVWDARSVLGPEERGNTRTPMERAGVRALVVLAVASISAVVGAQTPRLVVGGSRLVVGGSRAREGVHEVRAGFSPDPFPITVRPTGAIALDPMRLGPGCRGFVSAPEPDVIVRYSGTSSFLRFFARSSSDLALIVHDPRGRFLCNDDVVPGRDRRPMVDVFQPRAGAYEVWIATAEAGERPDATLFVTVHRDQRP